MKDNAISHNKINIYTKNISTQRLANIQIAIGSVMISFGAVFVKLTTTSPTMDAFYRMFFGGLVLLALAVARGQRCWRGLQPFYLTALAGVIFAVDLMFWHRGIERIGPGLATILINLQVFVLSVVGILLYREQFNWKFMLAIPLALLGMYFLVGYEWQSLTSAYKLGIYQCLIAMVCYTFYIFVLRKSLLISRPLDVIANIALVSLSSAFFIAIVSIFQGESFLIPTAQDGSWLVMYGLFGQVFGWLLISYGLAKAKISVAGFLLLLQPTMAFIWDILFFHRPTPAIEVIGAMLTLFAIYLSTTSKRVKKYKNVKL